MAQDGALVTGTGWTLISNLPRYNGSLPDPLITRIHGWRNVKKVPVMNHLKAVLLVLRASESPDTKRKALRNFCCAGQGIFRRNTFAGLALGFDFERIYQLERDWRFGWEGDIAIAG